MPSGWLNELCLTIKLAKHIRNISDLIHTTAIDRIEGATRQVTRRYHRRCNSTSNDISTTYTCKPHCLLLTRGLWPFWHCIMSFKGLVNNFSSLPSSISSFTFLTKDHAVDHLVPILLSAGEVKRLSRRLVIISNGRFSSSKKVEFINFCDVWTFVML